MATELGAAYISIIPETSKISGKIKEAFGDVGGVGSDAGKQVGGTFLAGLGKMVGPAAIAGIALKTGDVLKDAIGKAGELEQSSGAIGSVFKTAAADMLGFSKTAATTVGLTQDEYNKLGTVLGSQLKNAGVPMDELAGKTNEMVTLGADLASMFGGDTSQAVEALSSALKGERDPLEAYGVSLNQAAIDAKAAELGFSKVGGALSAEANQAATMALIMDQTADAHGNFAKESGTLAGQQQRMAATWENIQTQLGTAFLPIITEVSSFINTNVLPWVSSLTSGIGGGGLGGAFAAFQPVAARVGEAFHGLVAAVGPFIDQLISVLTPTVQNLLPVVDIVFNTIGSLVAGVMQVIQGVIQVATGAISGNWSQVWSGIQNIFGGIWNNIQAIVSGVIGVVGTVIRAGLSNAAGFVGSILGNIGRFFADTWNNVVNGVSSMIGNVVGFFSGLIGRITGAIGNAGSALFSVGVNIIQGLINGIGSMMGSIGRAVLNIVPEAIRGPFEDLLGIRSPSRVFREYGVNIGQGLILGIDGMHAKVADSVTGLVSVPSVPAFSTGSFTPVGAIGAAGGSGMVNNFSIQVDDPISTAHAVTRRLAALGT
ncbi:phage tail protein [Pseudarthrobacter sp. NS4]|uniref:phage tail protein n=1 Tax=Pseudarthrobacter sp. NS4 TaxID=2973976 RepID=UPI0021635FFC|nr:hypothetical protein [Pseudarthrobacter sp. NS4]